MMAIGWPALIIFGLLQPREDDLRSLQLQHEEVALLIGMAWTGENCSRSTPCELSHSQRSYIVFPRVLSNAAVMRIDDLPETRIITTDRGVALLVLGVWVLCLYATWRFLLAPLTRHLTMRWSGP